MSEQLLITVLFIALLYGLIFTKWAAEWVFVSIMLATYFTGLVSTEDVLDKASNSGVITLVLLLLVSTGIEKVSWLTQMSHKLIVPSYGGTLVRMGSVTAIFSAFVNNTAVVAALAHTVRDMERDRQFADAGEQAAFLAAEIQTGLFEQFARQFRQSPFAGHANT